MKQETKDQLIDYFDEVIQKEYPQNMEMYEFSKRNGRLETMFAQGEQKERKGKFNEFGIGGGNLPEYLALIFTTINLVIEIIRIRREGKELKDKEIKDGLLANQVEMKMPSEIAKLLIENYFPKLKKIIEEDDPENIDPPKNDES